MKAISSLALAVMAFTAPLLAQAPLTGTYELKKPNGDPVENGATWISVIIPLPGGGYAEWIFRKVGDKITVVPDECGVISPPDANGEYHWENNLGREGRMWRDADGQLKSEVTTGPNAGNVVHYH